MSTTQLDTEQPIADEPHFNEGLIRWIPIVVPMLAVLMAVETYVIAWAVLVRV
jgi:hypothetical protein